MYNTGMKLNVFKTNSYRNGADYIMRKLKSVNPLDLSVKHVVVVPDRASMSAEQLLLSSLSGSFNVEVRTLRQYANEIIPQTAKYLSKQSGIMVLTKIIFDNAEKLVCYKKGIRNNGFVESAYEVISQFMYARIKADDISLDNLPSALLAKMQDIKLIYGEYEQYLTDGYVDSATRLNLLIDAIADSSKVKKSYFYFYDFESFTRQEQDIIQSLTKHSLGVTVACCVSKEKSQDYLFPKETYECLRRIAENTDADCAEEIQNPATQYQDDFTRTIGENLYTYRKPAPLKIDAQRLTLCKSPSITSEVECLAQDICNYVRAGGRYRDYYVICSDVARYRLAVERIFADYRIPYFTDTQIKLADHPLSRYVLDYLAARKNNFKQDAMLIFVKNFYFTQDTALYAYENYCLKYNVGYRYDKFDLGKKDPTVDYDSANRIRAQFYNLTIKFPFADGEKTSARIKQIREFLLFSQAKEKSVQLAELCEKSNESQMASATTQALSKFEDILTQFENILGETFLSFEDFIRILEAGVSGANISVLPSRNDCVVLANMAKSRKHDIVALGLLGANDTAMPIVKKDTKLLSDKNISVLENNGICIQGKMYDENKLEKFSLYQLLLETRSHLFVSCCDKISADALGENLFPSLFFKSLQDYFTLDGKKYPVIQSPAYSVYTEDTALVQLADCVRKQKDRVEVRNPNFQLLTDGFSQRLIPYTAPEKQTVNISNGALLFETTEPTSVSKIETFNGCSKMHYFRYGLKIKPREKAKLEAQEFGIILHEVLQRYIVKIKEDEDDKLTAERALRYFERIIGQDKYRGITQDSRQESTVQLLRKESIALCLAVKRQLQNSEFVNSAAEYSFGHKDTDPIKVGDDIYLTGKVDRVDTCNNYFFIVDYKSGKTSASFSEGDLYAGLQLQLPIYVSAMKDVLGKKPVGFYYMHMHNVFIKDGEVRYAFSGRTLADTNIVKLIDKTLATEKRSPFLSVYFTKKNEFDNRTSKVLTEEEFNAEVEYAEKSVEKSDKLIREGYILANPFKSENPCQMCDYADICCARDIFPDLERIKPSRINAKHILSVIGKKGGAKQ